MTVQRQVASAVHSGERTSLFLKCWTAGVKPDNTPEPNHAFTRTYFYLPKDKMYDR
jgi:hypothetical protein